MNLTIDELHQRHKSYLGKFSNKVKNIFHVIKVDSLIDFIDLVNISKVMNFIKVLNCNNIIDFIKVKDFIRLSFVMVWILLKWIIVVEYWQSPTKDKFHQVIYFINLMNEIKVINFIRLIMFIKNIDQSIRETQLLIYIWRLTISEARIVILLLFWVGGGW